MGRHKGDIASAEVTYEPSTEWGVRTEWAVALRFQSPTGDSSDFITRNLPCLTREQACAIADRYNAWHAPEIVGAFDRPVETR